MESDRMKWMHGWVVLAAGMLALAAGPSQAAKAGADAQLQEQLDTLREDQQALRKEFDELKKLLQDRGVIPPPRVQKIDGVIELGVAPFKGSRAAPLTMVEFSDYQCPFCARHAQQTLPEIDRDYVATGKVRYVFRDLPLPIHPEAPKAAEAAHCAGDQGKYWEMHDWLFANQGALGAEKLVEYGTALGLDAASYKACLDSGKHAGRVAADVAASAEFGVRSTPTIIVGRSDGDKVVDLHVMRGAYPYAVFKEQIEAMLAAPATQ
jgi:protein-disulfide isomerase